MPPTNDEITHQQNLLTTYRQTLAHYLKQQALQGGEAFVQPGVKHGIVEARTNIARIKQILRSWNVPIEDHPDDGDARPEPTTQLPPARDAQSIARGTLRNMLNDLFSDDELRDLCFDLQIDYESLPGAGKTAKARELVTYCERHGLYAELIRHARQLRPNAPWS